MTKYVTNFTKGYCDHWSESQSIAEFVSNFLDSDGEQEFEFTEDSITLTNKNIIVSNKMLCSGLSNKRFDDTKRGTFGVGSLQAMVVLTALGIQVEIINGDILWIPRFELSTAFGEDILVIDEFPSYKGRDFKVHITGLSEETIDEVKQRCVVFQDRQVLYSTEIGDIICGEEGELFVGDMFVTQNKDFKYSYNFKPSVIPLTQDRNCMDAWEVKKLTAKLISLIDDEDFVKDAIEANKEDTRLVADRYYTDAYSRPIHSAVDAIGEDYVKEYGGKPVTSSYSDHREQEELGNPSVYIDNEVKVKTIKESQAYEDAIEDLELNEKVTPYEVVENLQDHLMALIEQKTNTETCNQIKDMLDCVLELSSDWSGESPELPF